jgi:TIR domain
MIILLHQPDGKSAAENMKADLEAAFRGRIEVALADANSSMVWPGDPSWDDLLVVVFEGSAFPNSGNDFITDYQKKRNHKGFLLPVALNATHTRPPKAAEAFKSLMFDAAAAGVGGRFVKRAGAMIGLRVQQRENKIFISYRATDGTAIAIQLEDHLKKLGYPVWRDEAKELDGLTKILPGTEVQSQIDAALEDASIVLLLDTPAAPSSPWIAHEVDTANGLLLPVLPLCFRDKTDSKKGSRFTSLTQLQRWIALALPAATAAPPLSDGELDQIVNEMEQYLCELIQRKCRVPSLVEKEFLSRNFTWTLLDKRLLVSESIKGQDTRVPTKVLSHCSIFDHVHGPAMKAFSDYMAKVGRPNHSLYIYDGDIIPEPQLLAFIKQNPSKDGVVILHHQELATLIDSNFTTVSI